MSLLKNKFQRITKKLKKHIRKTIKRFDKNVVFSVGENCLADNILARNELKSFSSPYASARSNIEYILSFEKEEFSDFLNMEYLVHENLGHQMVARNKKYVSVENHYHNSCLHGFEFTHHDVIDCAKYRNTLSKRCKRLRTLKNKNIVMLYHHRMCTDTDEALLTSHLRELAKIYKARKNEVHIFLFTQALVAHEDQRKVEHFVDDGISVYKFHTLNVWGGDDEDILFARCDNDLLEKMIVDIKNHLRK